MSYVGNEIKKLGLMKAYDFLDKGDREGVELGDYSRKLYF